MFCNECGQALAPGQAFCARCGRPVAPIVLPASGAPFELESYAGRVKAVAIAWFVYAGLTLLVGLASLAVMKAFFSGGIAPWMGMHGPMPPTWMLPFMLHFAWAFLALRSVLAVAAGWGLLEHTEWGRIVAIVAAFLYLLKFPIGTALGIWTMVVLLGYRNTTLYQQL
jgi:hypothetical protein